MFLLWAILLISIQLHRAIGNSFFSVITSLQSILLTDVCLFQTRSNFLFLFSLLSFPVLSCLLSWMCTSRRIKWLESFFCLASFFAFVCILHYCSISRGTIHSWFMSHFHTLTEYVDSKIQGSPSMRSSLLRVLLAPMPVCFLHNSLSHSTEYFDLFAYWEKARRLEQRWSTSDSQVLLSWAVMTGLQEKAKVFLQNKLFEPTGSRSSLKNWVGGQGTGGDSNGGGEDLMCMLMNVNLMCVSRKFRYHFRWCVSMAEAWGYSNCSSSSWPLQFNWKYT